MTKLITLSTVLIAVTTLGCQYSPKDVIKRHHRQSIVHNKYLQEETAISQDSRENSYTHEVKMLVNCMASEQYAKREKATRELREIIKSENSNQRGLTEYLSMLLTETTDPEVAYRIERVLDPYIRPWKLFQFLHELKGHKKEIESVTFSPDGQLLASAGADKTVRIWDTRSFQCKAVLKCHTGLLCALSFSPNGKMLYSGGGDKGETIIVWDTYSGKVVDRIKGHNDCIFNFTFSPDGKFLASSSMDNTVRIWNVDTQECLQVLRHKEYEVPCCLTFSPDGKLLATGSFGTGGDLIRIWNPYNGKCQRVFESHSNGVYSLEFNPSGNILVSGGNDKAIKIWDSEKGTCQRILKGHTEAVLSVAFNKEGIMLASASADCLVKLWDINTGKCKRTLDGHVGSVRSITFSPDGSMLASASWDKTIIIWGLPEEKGEAELINLHTESEKDTQNPPGEELQEEDK